MATSKSVTAVPEVYNLTGRFGLLRDQLTGYLFTFDDIVNIVALRDRIIPKQDYIPRIESDIQVSLVAFQMG